MATSPYPPGTRINDRYELLEHLGDGADSEVYRAHDEHLDTIVALKLLDPKGGPPAAWDEARILEQLRSDYLLPVINADIVGTSDIRYITTELMTGGDAETAAAPHGVDVSVAVRWGQQLGHALDRVHAGGLVHRDVKPANAFLRDGDVLLGDLGRAALLNPAGVAGREGTWCTTAPETAPDDGVCSRASDVYSLAATVFYLLSGEYPVDDSLSDLKRQALITAGRRRRLRDLAPHVSRGLAMVIEKSLSTNPTHRHQSALDFGNALVGAGVHERAWRRVSHPGHQHCLRGGAAATVKPVTVCAVASGPRVTVMARLDSGRRPPGWMDREGRLAKLAQLLRAATESL